jgi:hypothetical protein
LLIRRESWASRVETLAESMTDNSEQMYVTAKYDLYDLFNG